MVLTPAGGVLVTAVIVGYPLGVVLGYPILIALAGAGVLALVAAAGYVLWRPRLILRRDFRPQTVVVGESAAALLGVTNGSRWPSPGVTVGDRLGASGVELAVRPLAAGSSRMMRYALPTTR
ncbi:MAG: DUF58 domain-containing protein, partial [Actinomycetota bacterium]|nr:DUF58 domain-containing protein [Actinomycetota bacterium]